MSDIFALAAGVLINTQASRPIHVILAGAAASTISMALVIGWKIFIKGGICLSGVIVNLSSNPKLSTVLLLFLVCATVLGITVCAYSRPVTLGKMENAMRIPLEKAKSIEKLINVFARISTTAAIMFFALA